MMLEVKNLSFSYEAKKHILKDLSFSIKQGEIVGIIGPNGAGKSTLIKILAKILTNFSGEIYFNKTSIKLYKQKQIAKSFGYIPQKIFVNNILVKDYLLMGRYAFRGLFGYSKKDFDALKKIAKSLQIEEFLQVDISTLSGGQSQKVALARALLKNPKLLLLDEPTSALDISHSLKLMGILELYAKNGISSIVILHDLNLASLFCTKILLLKDGEKLAFGESKEILTTKILKQCFSFESSILELNDASYIAPLKFNLKEENEIFSNF